jgi:adenylate cyclase class IV
MKALNLFLTYTTMDINTRREEFFHECEIKYKIEDEVELNGIIELVEQKGFEFVSKNKETDFLPDVEGFLCRKNGILLRFRKIEGKDKSDILVTVKVKGNAKQFQEYHELEYSFQNYNDDIFQKINELTYGITGVKLPQKIHSTDDFNDLVNLVKNTGFTKHRIWLEKIRKKYTRGNEIVTIDLLPEGIGYYLELETDSESKLNKLIKEFELDSDLLETMDYGDILKKHKEGCTEKEQRTGLFDQES